MVSCSETKKEESKTEKKEILKENSNDSTSPKRFCEKIPSQGYGTFIPPKTVHWMYLDDSLKNVCRALNFQLPWMESDIKIIPEMITPEILSLSPIRTFEIMAKSKVIKNDSVTFFYFNLKKDNCDCDVARIYKGKISKPGFDGYEITEQIVCNAKDDFNLNQSWKKEKLIEKDKENDSTKYEVHGHEH